jgi:hypothetical protein
MSIKEVNPVCHSDALVGQCTRKVDLCASVTMDKHGRAIVGRAKT